GLTKVALDNTEGAIVVNSRPAAAIAYHDMARLEPPSPAYAVVEHHLQPIFEARARLSFQEAHDLLARAQEAVRVAQLAAEGGPPAVSPSKPQAPTPLTTLTPAPKAASV